MGRLRRRTAARAHRAGAGPPPGAPVRLAHPVLLGTEVRLHAPQVPAVAARSRGRRPGRICGGAPLIRLPVRVLRPALDNQEERQNNGERLRPRGHRLGHRRLRRRDPRRAARPLHRRRRARADARRHLPELGLHSDQGAPRARARAEGRAGLEGVGADDRSRPRSASTWRRCTRARTRSSRA